MRDLISHPGILLYDHLLVVGTRAASILLKLASHFRLAISGEDLARAAFIAGVCHDFGKAKQQFQDYIHGGKSKDKEHAALSSVFTFLVASQAFGNKGQPARLLPFVCAYVVNRHHGLLYNLEEVFEETTIEHQLAIGRDKLDERVWSFEFEYRPLNVVVRFSDYHHLFHKISVNDVEKPFLEFGKRLRQKAEKKDAPRSWLIDLYFALLLVVSVLAEADVACAISAPEPEESRPLNPELVREYARSQPSGSPLFQQLRQSAWQELEQDLDLSVHSALRITLPTGLGKTLMGLYLSGKLQAQDYTTPVIYALPYLSIIEQATDVARSVFGNSSVSVIQHHSLSFPAPQKEETPNFEQARFVLEDWAGDLVVTTFDQLFYSFLSSDRGFIRRFFRIPGSVLLLDEVQTIPPRLIPAVDTFLRKLYQKIGTRVIYMTATHPAFRQGIRSLVRNESTYFQSLARTRLHLQLNPIPFSCYLSQLGNWLLQRKGKKVLLVANTIRSAQELFQHLNKLREDCVDFTDLRLFHLSGSVVPVERLRRIRQVRNLIENNPGAWVVVVSTQCVEAGVDLDMDEAVRDFAPWDSLLQICGRANRFGKKPCADVWVYRWIDDLHEQTREFHRYIYDSVFTDTTLSVLQDRVKIEENDYWNIQQLYVRELEQRLSREQSDNLLRAALSWRFDELDFQKLFRGEDRAWRIPIFCAADGGAEYLRDIALELWSSKEPLTALEMLMKFCDQPHLFQPLQYFLRVHPETVKRHAESLKGSSGRNLRFGLGRLLGPLLQAYTISLIVKRLESLPAVRITEGFLYLPRSVYESLNDGAQGEIPARPPDWII